MELFDLREREIQRVVMPVGPLAVGKPLGHVADRLQLGVVHHDGHVVLREHDILLQEIRAHRVGQHLGLQRVLGQIPAGAAMRDDDGLRGLGGHGQGQGAQQGSQYCLHHSRHYCAIKQPRRGLRQVRRSDGTTSVNLPDSE